MRPLNESQNAEEIRCLRCFRYFNPAQVQGSKFCINCQIQLLELRKEMNFLRMLEEEVEKIK